MISKKQKTSNKINYQNSNNYQDSQLKQLSKDKASQIKELEESGSLANSEKTENETSLNSIDLKGGFDEINDGNFISQKNAILDNMKDEIRNDSFFSKAFMYDYLKILIRCSKSIKIHKILSLKHVPPLSQEQQVDLKFQILDQKLSQLIHQSNIEHKEISKFKIISILLSAFKQEITFLILTNTLYMAFKILYSSLLISLLDAVSGNSSNSLRFTLAFVMALVQFLGISAGHNISRFFFNFLPVFKAAFMKILFQKILSLSAFSVKQANVGKLINLVSNDLNTLDTKGIGMIKMISAPFDLAIIVIILYQRLGASSLIGFVFILSNPLFQTLFAKLSQRFFKVKAQLVDQRIKFTNEVIEGIRLIKMYAWEDAFIKFVQVIRNNEISKILITQIIFVCQQSLNSIFNLLACFISFISIYYLGDPSILTVPKMLSVLDLFSFAKSEIIFYVSIGITGFYESKVIVDRVIAVLNIKQQSMKHISEKSNEEYQVKDEFLQKGQINMKNFKVFWNENTPVLQDINLDIKKGEFVVITGRICSGKSSLLNCILQEVPFFDGHFKFNGKVAYVEQEPYIFSSSIKENILFGLEYNEQLYSKVLDACCLNEDIQYLDNGDLTEIGERGVNLSGGQKARISLARAIYSQSDIILLDDPLSAVDSKVANLIIEKAILKLLKGKTILMTTHHLHFTQKADKILIMKGGQIYKQGIYQDLQQSLKDIFNSLEFNKIIIDDNHPQNYLPFNYERFEENKNVDKEEDQIKQNEKEQENKNKSNQIKQIFTKESDENMVVDFSTYKKYFQHSSFKWLIFIVFALFLSCEIVYVFYTKTISKSTKQDDEDILNRLNLLGYLTLIYFVIYFLKYLLFTLIIYSSNKNIHQSMIKSIVRATILFFDTTPSGRILNKFSSDLGILDQAITRTMIISLEVISITCVYLATIFIINPYFMIVVFLQANLTRKFVKFSKDSLQQSKQLALRNNSPIFTCFNQTIQGVLLIKIYKKESKFLKNFSVLLENSLRATLAFSFNQRVFSMYVHLLATLFSNLGIFMLLLTNKNSDSLGQAIILFISISDFMQVGLRMIIETDTTMSSAQRIINMIDIDQEPETRLENDTFFIEDSQISTQNKKKTQIYNFPVRGTLEFHNVRMKYRQDLSFVLNGLSFIINAGEKVGFVGRTGAGKSSIIQALYRLTEIEDEPDINRKQSYIKIDGFNLKELGIHTIRQGISIIPQTSFVFSGSIRRNLDPLNQYSDSQINQILEEISLKNKISNLKDGMNTDMTNSNDVFSSGEKQLICLGRAILRQSKLIVLDEATANCDLQTDKIIQQKIRERFKNSTLITIAHRLNTIADYDRIIVLENGSVIEQGIPYELLMQENSFFRKMVLQTGQNNFNQIFKIAQHSIQK